MLIWQCLPFSYLQCSLFTGCKLSVILDCQRYGVVDRCELEPCNNIFDDLPGVGFLQSFWKDHTWQTSVELIAFESLSTFRSCSPFFPSFKISRSKVTFFLYFWFHETALALEITFAKFSKTYENFEVHVSVVQTNFNLYLVIIQW